MDKACVNEDEQSAYGLIWDAVQRARWITNTAEIVSCLENQAVDLRSELYRSQDRAGAGQRPQSNPVGVGRAFEPMQEVPVMPSAPMRGYGQAVASPELVHGYTAAADPLADLRRQTEEVMLNASLIEGRNRLSAAQEEEERRARSIKDF